MNLDESITKLIVIEICRAKSWILDTLPGILLVDGRWGLWNLPPLVPA